MAVLLAEGCKVFAELKASAFLSVLEGNVEYKLEVIAGKRVCYIVGRIHTCVEAHWFQVLDRKIGNNVDEGKDTSTCSECNVCASLLLDQALAVGASHLEVVSIVVHEEPE